VGRLRATVTFTGRETDGPGLNFYRARYYDPRRQRFGNRSRRRCTQYRPAGRADDLRVLRDGGWNCSDPGGNCYRPSSSGSGHDLGVFQMSTPLSAPRAVSPETYDDATTSINQILSLGNSLRFFPDVTTVGEEDFELLRRHHQLYALATGDSSYCSRLEGCTRLASIRISSSCLVALLKATTIDSTAGVTRAATW
jgi:hypothetical protein